MRTKNIITVLFLSAAVSTGTSKDGMTSIFLRYFYPDDITVSTAFCSPFYASLNFLPVGSYLNDESGTPEERNQMRVLMERLIQNGENGMDPCELRPGK